MPRLKKVPCAHCDAKLVPGTSFCAACEQPTIWASADERTTWELRQWQEKGTPRTKRAAPKRTEVTSLKAEVPAPLKPAPLVPHPTAVKAGLVKAAPAPKVSAPMVTAPKVAALKKSAPKKSPPKVSAPKKQVAVSKPEPARAPEKPRKAIEKPVKAEPVVAQAPTTIDLTDAPSAKTEPAIEQTKRDPAIEQVELLRELLQRVISIEEKMGGNGTGRVRRLRLLKR
jgi:hypothetical protein